MLASHSSSGGIGELLKLGARKIAFLSGTRSILHPYLNMIMYFIVLEKGIFSSSFSFNQFLGCHFANYLA